MMCTTSLFRVSWMIVFNEKMDGDTEMYNESSQ